MNIHQPRTWDARELGMFAEHFSMIRKLKPMDLVKHAQILLMQRLNKPMFGTEIPPFFYFSEDNSSVISLDIITLIQEATGEGMGRKAKVGQSNHSLQCVHT